MLASRTNLFKLDDSVGLSKCDLDQHSPFLAEISDDATFIGQMDREAVITLCKLSANVEGFTLKELKQIHRRSRVAVEAEMTSNMHVHKRILNLLEKHVVIETEERMLRRLHGARREVMTCHKTALERLSRCHNGLMEVKRQKLKVEEEYVEALMDLNLAEQEKNKVISVIETRNRIGGRRRRTISM